MALCETLKKDLRMKDEEIKSLNDPMKRLSIGKNYLKFMKQK